MKWENDLGGRMMSSIKITKKWVKNELDFVVKKISENKDDFFEKVPAAASIKQCYPAEDNNYWTASFWVGMLWLAKEYTESDEFDEIIASQMNQFKKRLDEKIELNTHDIGFLYTLSSVADYRITGSKMAKEMVIRAADELMTRYHPKAEIIQAWGDLDDPEQQGRMIIDCNMNLPLLYFASQMTGDDKYKNAAYAHAKQAAKYIIRPDYSTYHTYYMDTITGEPKYGKTAQGYSDDSCWARGQAWGIYGFTLSYLYTGDPIFLDTASHLADYFIEHLPKDKVCYWDLIFVSGEEERDSSSAAIAACGLLELSKQLPFTNVKKELYNQVTTEMIESLANCYTTKNTPESNGILLHAVYSKPDNKGVDECNIWGDYFYMEALMRIYKSWYPYW